eukprot:Clim_evm52s148 gene=Clim_evmTU52s148
MVSGTQRAPGTGEVLRLLSDLSLENQLEAYYTGGPITLDATGRYLGMNCEDTIKILDLHVAKVVCTIPGDGEVFTSILFGPVSSSSFERVPEFMITASRSLQVRVWQIVEEPTVTDVPADDDIEVVTYSVLTANETRAFRAHQTPVVTMVANPKCHLMATGSGDGEVRVWDLQGFFATHNFKHLQGSPVTALTFHALPEVFHLAAGNGDGQMAVFDLEASKPLRHVHQHVSTITSLSYTSDGAVLLSAGRDQLVHFWELESDYGHKDSIAALEPLEDAFFLPVYWTLDSLIDEESRLIAEENPSNGKDDMDEGDTEKDNHGATSPLPLVSGDLEVLDKTYASTDVNSDLFFVTVGHRGRMKLWDARRRRAVLAEKPLVDAARTADNEIVGYERIVLPSRYPYCLRAVDNGEEESEDLSDYEFITVSMFQNLVSRSLQSLEISLKVTGQFDEVVDARFLDRNGDHIVVASNTNELHVIGRHDLHTEVLFGHTEMPLCLDVHRPTGMVVSGGKDCLVNVYHFAVTEKIKQKQRHRKSGQAAGGHIFISHIGVAKGHSAAVAAVSVAPKTGSFMATGGQDRSLKIWNLGLQWASSTVTSVPALRTVIAHEKDINAISISPNDKLIATASQDKTAKLWNANDLTLFGTLRGHRRGVWDIAFSPSDQVVATASGDRTVRLWAVGTRECLRTIEGHNNSVLKAQFISSGLQLATVASDGLMKVFTLKTAETAFSTDAHDDRIWSLDVLEVHNTDNNGKTMSKTLALTAGSDGRVRVWKDTTAERAAREQEEMAEATKKEQELSNLVAEQRYLEAALLALTLERPFRLLTILRTCVSDVALSDIPRNFVKEMPDEQMGKLFQYCRDWNTSARNSAIAQVVIAELLKKYPPTKLTETPSLRPLIDALEVYSRRHFDRIGGLQQEAKLLDFVYGRHALDAQTEQ